MVKSEARDALDVYAIIPAQQSGGQVQVMSSPVRLCHLSMQPLTQISRRPLRLAAARVSHAANRRVPIAGVCGTGGKTSQAP